MSTVQKPTVSRDPRRVHIPLDSWTLLPLPAKEEYFVAADREIEEVGVVVVANALSEDKCDAFIALIAEEVRTACAIEQTVHERQAAYKGYKVRNFQSRHAKALDLIAFPFVIEYFRRFLSAEMELHSSEGVILPPGTGDGPLHYDGWDRIPNYFLSMNSIYYLCDANSTNGATRYVPGTHKEFISGQEAAQREHKYLEVKKGDLVLFNPYLFHASSANRSNADRPVIINYYQRGYIKPEFDYPRMMSVAEAKKLTKDQRILLGFGHRVPVDIHELYMTRGARIGDRDPVGLKL